MLQKKSKKITLLNTTLLVLAGLLVFSGCVKKQRADDSQDNKKKASVEEKEKQNPEEEKEIITQEQQKTNCEDELDTFCWKTYRNEKYGYEIMYPEDWSVDDYGGPNIKDPYSYVYLGTIKIGNFVGEMRIMTNYGWDKLQNGFVPNINNDSLSLKEKLKDYIWNIDNSFEFTIGEQHIDVVRTEEPGMDIEYDFWFINHEGRLYSISYIKESKNQKLLEKMLNTFKFIQ